MPALSTYGLTFRSGLHLGSRGVNLEEARVCVPSDTLFAALVDALARDGIDPADLVGAYPQDGSDGAGDPPFLLTSAFPFAGGVRFYPMPVPLVRFFTGGVLSTRRKELKRIRFVSEALLLRVLRGEVLDRWLFPSDGTTRPSTGVALQGNALWLTVDEVDDLPERMQRGPDRQHALRRLPVYAAGRVPRVTVDRISSASEIYHAGRVSFAPECGLWFGIEWRRPDMSVGANGPTVRGALLRALALLADDGLGGERSAGYGAFTYKEGGPPLTLPDPEPGGLALLLSRYHPRPQELPDVLTGEGAAYSLGSVAGWLRSWDGPAQRRKRVWLLDEGSVIRPSSSGPLGDLADVHPAYDNPDGDLPHPVWRYGVALAVALAEVADA